MHLYVIAAHLAGLLTVASAKDSRTFAVNHFYGKGPLTEGRMDPIISPGAASSHVHAIQGGSNFNLTMETNTLLDSSCTSSLVEADKSNYWTPTLYFQDHTNGSFISVPMFYMNVYYLYVLRSSRFLSLSDSKIASNQPMMKSKHSQSVFAWSVGITVSAHHHLVALPTSWTRAKAQSSPCNGPVPVLHMIHPRTLQTLMASTASASRTRTIWALELASRI